MINNKNYTHNFTYNHFNFKKVKEKNVNVLTMVIPEDVSRDSSNIISIYFNPFHTI